MLNHKLSRKAQLFLLGALLGVAIFLLVYGTAPLNVANDAFCRGGYIEKDIQQHYAGWLFYKRSAIGWPLGVTDAVNYPGGVSVAYTDSIPLLAALCRPLAAALGGTFQYFGWFTLVCFARLCRQPCFDRTRVPAHLTGGAMACAGSALLLFCL